MITILPCPIYSGCSEELTKDYTTNNLGDNDDCDQGSNDCSPLAQCNGCLGFVTLVHNIKTKPFQINNNNLITFNLPQKDFYLQIWQPPKIS